MNGAIFDMDGLMFDTEKLWQKNWHAIAAEMHITLDPAFGKEICGTSGDLMAHVIEKYYHVENGHAIARDCTDRVHADLEKEVPEKPGIHEILQWLKAHGFQIAVASSSPRALIERNLRMTDTLPYIDACCSGTEVQHGKPAPDLFLYAAELIHVPIEQCYIFEDAYNGIRAAYNAGGRGIMVPDTQEPDEEMTQKAHAICPDLLAALEVIKKEVNKEKSETEGMVFKPREYHAPDFTNLRFTQAPDVTLLPAPKEGVVPEHYHSTTIFPEYFKINGTWHLAEESRMDCCAVWKDNHVQVVEFRNIHKGDLVVIGRSEDGSEGIYVWPNGFTESEAEQKDLFAFRQGRSRETAFSKDYDNLYELLNYERDHGNIVWVMGPACAFDHDSRTAFQHLVEEGYVDALLAGNALATHDLEGAYLGTALGQDIYTTKSQPLGHYNHLDTLNRIRYYGSIPSFIEHEHIDNGIIYSCVKNNIPFVLAGSIRDDGPQPEIYGNVYEAQNAMRDCIRKATTVICMATTLHSIATGNMTPSFRVMPDGTIRQVYFYVVDISEFAVNKLADRGSLSARSIVTNAQDFVTNVYKGVHALAGKKTGN